MFCLRLLSWELYGFVRSPLSEPSISSLRNSLEQQIAAQLAITEIHHQCSGLADTVYLWWWVMHNLSWCPSSLCTTPKSDASHCITQQWSCRSTSNKFCIAIPTLTLNENLFVVEPPRISGGCLLTSSGRLRISFAWHRVNFGVWRRVITCLIL